MFIILGIILFILKIILAIIGIILGIILFILIFVLVAPFKYNIKVEKVEVLNILTKVSLFFGIIRFEYIQKGEDSQFNLFYPFGKWHKNADPFNATKDDDNSIQIQSYDNNNNKDYSKNAGIKSADTSDKEHNTEGKTADIREINYNTEGKTADTSDKNYQTEAKSEAINSNTIINDKHTYDNEVNNSFNNEDKKEDKKDKFNISDTINKVKNYLINKKNLLTKNIMSLKKYIKLVERLNYKYDFKVILAEFISLIKKIFKNMGFKVFKINGIIGYTDPYKTGQVLGGIAIVNGILPIDISVSGNFHNEILEGDILLKGRSNLLKLLYPLIFFVLKKPILKIVIDFIRGDINE